MKPRFALNLSNDDATLLERSAEGWVPLGRAPFDAPDLKAQLDRLRAMAEARAPEGFVTKLILPNSQILYFEATAPGADRAARRALIVKALSGRTPYHVDDLVFDFTGGGAKASVAVVTRLTLAEAEEFAAEHGFRPAAFVAIPEPGRYAGEPFFGTTARASEWLGAQGRYDRDQDPVRIVEAPAAAFAPAPEPGPAPEPEPEAEAEAAQDLGQPVAAEEEPALLSPLPVEEAPDAGLVSAETEEATPPPQDPAPAEAEEAPFIALEDEAEPEESPILSPLAEGAATDATILSVTAENLPEEEAENAPSPADVEEAPGGSGFHSRRRPVAHTAESATAEEPGARLVDIVPRLGGMAGLSTTAGATAAKAAPVRPFQPVADIRDLTGVERVATLVAQARPHPAPKPTGPAFGGLGPSAARLAGLDTTRLAAGAAAFLLLAGVLFWAFLGADPAPQTTDSEVAGAAAPAPAETAPAEAQPPTPTPTAPEPAAPAEQQASEPAPAPDLAEPQVAAAAPAAQGAAPATEASAPGGLAGDPAVPHATDAATLPPLAALTGDAPLPGQALPQPFGTLLRYDANGMIIATPDGVIAPGGFRLVAGQPPRRPPARPAGLAPAPALPASAPLTDAAGAPMPFADPALADKRPRPRPAGLTPPPAAAAPDDGASLPPPAPPVDSRHAALKPKARPAAVAAAAAARRAQDEAVADAAASAARAEAEAAAAAMAKASPQAVATSRRPKARTAAAVAAAAAARVAEASAVDTSAVEAALAEAQTVPDPAAAPVPEPEPAPEPPPAEVDEPEPQDGIATLPTTRTVAKKSTYANAIDLGEVNLIGVYGSSSNRRALVRMPNGRFVKVQVGDRLDGGKVAAIGDGELRYVKKGRTITLKIMKNG